MGMTNTTAINTTSLTLNEGDRLSNGAVVLAVVVTNIHTDSKLSMVEDGYVLARRDLLSPTGYVTWAYKVTTPHKGDESIDTFWGHYDLRFFDAVTDLAERAGVQA
jgi:hypothetical protein